MDANLVNGWGLVSSPTSPFWVADQNTSESTLYMSNSALIPLVVQIPCTVDGAVTTPCPYPTRGQFFEPLAGKTNLFGPTGIVWNAFSTSGAFTIPGSSQPASFIFATLDGLIVGWNAQVNRTQGMVVANRSANGASYSGLAIAAPAGTLGEDLIQASFLYATNSAPGGKIDVFDSRFNLVSSFDADAKVPTGFAPYGIQAFGNKLYVTYFNPTGQGGILDVCDLTTNLTAPACRRLYVSLPQMAAPAAGGSAITVANPVFQTTVLNAPLGHGVGTGGLRTAEQHASGRQRERRYDPRLRSRHRSVHRNASFEQRQTLRYARVMGTATWTGSGGQRRPQSTVLHRRAGASKQSDTAFQ
jgi:hypothetical protein